MKSSMSLFRCSDALSSFWVSNIEHRMTFEGYVTYLNMIINAIIIINYQHCKFKVYRQVMTLLNFRPRILPEFDAFLR